MLKDQHKLLLQLAVLREVELLRPHGRNEKKKNETDLVPRLEEVGTSSLGDLERHL